MLNMFSSIYIRELGNQYLCDPQWFMDTASRGLTTPLTLKTHFRTYLSDNGNPGFTTVRGFSPAKGALGCDVGGATRQILRESEVQNDEEIEHSILVRRRARQVVDDEVDVLAARVDEME
ncbi:hypothetical protein F511_24010 [Dorcoceras hygrometricum]|uniref:Uncharacterized protein n=1 Tax=Dorcoceras hygrometricum TaxID=472368 RepID=A0A2Z7B7D9_9LAMI|nr:hypothetical protein F511_24010 [Dorcoceras hygrometricum]